VTDTASKAVCAILSVCLPVHHFHIPPSILCVLVWVTSREGYGSWIDLERHFRSSTFDRPFMLCCYIWK